LEASEKLESLEENFDKVTRALDTTTFELRVIKKSEE